MWGRRVLVLLLSVLLPGLAEAADCVAARDGDVSLVEGAGCDGLTLTTRRRDDPRDGVDVVATWVEFVEPGNAGEWRYNEWVRRQVGALNFDRPLVPNRGHRIEDRLSVASLYRSERLISARYARWVCCSLQAMTIYGSVNVDISRWTLLSPDALVSLGAAADRCWRRFAEDPERGSGFAEAYPVKRAWSDDDFQQRQIGRTMHAMLGPLVVEPTVSQERTHRLFVEVLKDQSRWSFAGQGAQVDFGQLLGAAAGAFFCALANDELQQMARPGVAFPP